MLVIPTAIASIGVVVGLSGVPWLFGREPRNAGWLLGPNTIRPGRTRLAGLVFAYFALASIMVTFRGLRADPIGATMLWYVPLILFYPVAFRISVVEDRKAKG